MKKRVCCISPYVTPGLIGDTEDVWDEDSAYLEMLAREVLITPVAVFYLLLTSSIRVLD